MATFYVWFARRFLGVTQVAKPGGSGFYFLNVTQFLGAFNDNILKQVLMFGLALGGVWAGVLGEGGQAWASICLAVPFVLFSGFAGQFSDKYSKRRISIMAKWSEIPIALLAMIGLWLTNLPLVLFALFAIALQSTFFSPSKFGILPEIIPNEKLSRANGTINMFTWFAIILGCALGGWIYDHYAPSDGAAPMLWLPGVVILIVGISGTITSHGISVVPRQNPDLKISYWLVDGYYKTWRHFRGTTAMSALIAYSFFYMIIVGIAAMIMPDYKDILGISATATSMLFVILAVFMGVGDYVAGVVSGHRIRPELVTYGNLLTAAAFLALGFAPANFLLVAVLLGLGGFMCGFVLVPLQTMIQYFSGDEQRGQVLGFWNCLVFSGVIVGNLFFFSLRNYLDVSPEHVWIVCSVLTIVFQVLYSLLWRKSFVEALAGVEVDES